MPIPGVLRRPSGWLAPPGVPMVDYTDSINAGLTSSWLLSQSLKDLAGRNGAASQVGATPAMPGLTALGLTQTTSSGQFFDFRSSPAIASAVMSVSFWLRATSQVTTTYTTLFSQGDNGSVQPRYFDCRLGVGGGAGPPFNLGFGDYDGATSAGVISTLDLNSASNVNKLFHIVGTTDGVTAQIFVNGQFNGSGVSRVPSSSSVPFNIGYLNGNGTPIRAFSGNVDNIRTYSRILTRGEVARLYVDPWAGLVFPRDRPSGVLWSPAAAAAFLSDNRWPQWGPVLAQ